MLKKLFAGLFCSALIFSFSPVYAQNALDYDEEIEFTQEELETEVQALQEEILSNDEIMSEIQTLLQDPEIVEILSNPALVQAITSYDVNAIQNNPDVQELMENPKIVDLIEKISALYEQ